MPYHGDYAPASSVVFNFNTAAYSDGSPITLAGTPALSVYKNSTTESTSGVTLTVDYDSRTGMHHVVIDTSSDGTFYAAGNDFDVIITAGTVGGTSVVGRVVGSFSLNNRSALRPATAGRTFAVDSSGGAPVSVGTGTGQINVSSGKVPATLASTDVTGNVAADLQTIKTQSVTCAAGVTVYAYVGASAAPGASGGVFIAGTNDHCTITNALTVSGATVLTGNVSLAAGLTIRQSTTNANAVDIVANGTGHGVYSASGNGATGDGWHTISMATNGNGSAHYGSGHGNGSYHVGGDSTSGDGIHASGGLGASVGIRSEGGGTSGSGAVFTATAGDSDGLTLIHTGAGKDFNATTTPLTLAKTTNITGFNDIAASSIVSGGAITVSSGALILTSAYDAAKTAAQAGDAMTLTSGERNATADNILIRDWTATTGSVGEPARYSLMNAARVSANKVDTTSNIGFLTVYREDGTTTAFTKAIVVSATAELITSAG